MGEWIKPSVSKTDAQINWSEGSNPSFSAKIIHGSVGHNRASKTLEEGSIPSPCAKLFLIHHSHGVSYTWILMRA